MKQRADSYRGFATHYDLYRWDWFEGAYGTDLYALLEKHGYSGGRVLDAGCGTGTLAIALARRGYQVTGLDLSETMIEVARKKDLERVVRWHVGDVTRFDLGDQGAPFDVITCVADILNHLETIGEWDEALGRFAAHLRPGGALLLDVMTCLGLRKLDKMIVEEYDDKLLIIGVIYEPATRRSTAKVTSFVPLPGGRQYERASETITEWGQPAEEILGCLARSGFSKIERLWTKEADPENGPRLQLLAFRE